MIKTFRPLMAALALASSPAALAQTLSAPTAVPIVDRLPAAADTPYPGGAMQLGGNTKS